MELFIARSHDGYSYRFHITYGIKASKVSWQWVVRGLTSEQAASICGEHTGIRDADLEACKAAPRQIRIERVKDRKPQEYAWTVKVDYEPVLENGVPFRLSDADLQLLMGKAQVAFDVGQPDWEQRQIEDFEDQAENLALQEVEVEKKIAAATGELQELRRQQELLGSKIADLREDHEKKRKPRYGMDLA